jgi:ParB family chromosome partitioning protein
LVKNYQDGLKPKTSKTAKPISFVVLDTDKKELASKLGTKVDVKIDASGQGKITIPFKSEADFQRILNLIKG